MEKAEWEWAKYLVIDAAEANGDEERIRQAFAIIESRGFIIREVPEACRREGLTHVAISQAALKEWLYPWR